MEESDDMPLSCCTIKCGAKVGEDLTNKWTPLMILPGTSGTRLSDNQCYKLLWLKVVFFKPFIP